jgi:hypothetical protein
MAGEVWQEKFTTAEKAGLLRMDSQTISAEPRCPNLAYARVADYALLMEISL